MRGATIDILLAVYNGERFLRPFLDSLVRQSFRDFRLVVSDNRSSDHTNSILEEYRSELTHPLLILPLPDAVASAHTNFARVTEAAEGQYVMYADADDIWHADKIGKTFAAMKAAERKFGATTPILVHSDLAVVNEQLHCLDTSFWRYQFIDPRRTGLNQLLLQNCVTGCTVMLNRPLLELGKPVPPDACAHDHWFALVASAFGHIAVVPESLIDYRQHGRNVTGAKQWGPRYVAERARRLYAADGARQTIALNIQQAQAFLSRFRCQLSSEQVLMVQSFAGIRDRGILSRRLTLVRNALWKRGVVRNLGLLLAI
ncbi:MAG TPA: glycosyltransferase family 2 protein [Rhizomicrobium sp.]|nr:glycosyltransferase family 2 protein [Rhizomicrobium sp.]